mmetsp:Transcript_33887/g.74344  ORF Transcript_33887/g.74344 Transcript_33887/m.74344 type:complete len:143 (+) Transcript_33887:159-587(+)
MATMLIAATLFTIAISGRRHILMRRKEQKEMQQGDATMCDNAEKMQVCSHQIQAMGFPGRSSPPDGSKQAMVALWNAGIHCFDIDIVTLKDGSLLVTHPSRFAARIGERKPEQYALDADRADGADENNFPLLEDILETFASL